MNPKEPPVMDVQRPRQNSSSQSSDNPMIQPMAPADSIASMSPDPGQPPKFEAPKERRTGLIVAIVTTVFVLLVVGGVGGFILFTNREKAGPSSTNTQSESQRVNVVEIDSITAEIDKTMNSLNDSTDVTPGDVSDASLGL